MKLTDEELFIELKKVCAIRASELCLLGTKATSDEVWEFILANKKDKIEKIHQLISEIFSVEREEFIDWKKNKK
jgi:hypothetical protein